MRWLVSLRIAGLLSLCLIAVARADVTSPPVPAMDPGALPPAAQESDLSAAVLDAGKAQFEAVCSACHGANGRGGRGGAPDLLTSSIALDDAARFRAWVRAGSPSRGMPGFALDDATLDAIHAHLVTLAAAARRRGPRQIAVVGDPERGRTFFEGEGGCTGCHSVTGDLKGIGARYTPRVLQGRIVLPRGSGVHPGLIALGVRIPGVTDQAAVIDSPRTVTVTMRDGARIAGVLLGVSDFDVALRDADGHYRSFARRGGQPTVEIHDPAEPHIAQLGRLADRDLNDLTAYLASLQ